MSLIEKYKATLTCDGGCGHTLVFESEEDRKNETEFSWGKISVEFGRKYWTSEYGYLCRRCCDRLDTTVKAVLVEQFPALAPKLPEA